ncbi:MAG TPA: hypothetical protein DIU20_05055, partial [Cryomorphaceae bacterium]|nr:hypothetical protein [Cryomorphaceae bacterium]
MNHSEKHLEQFVEEIVRSLKPKLEDQALIECFLLFIHAKQTKSEFHRVEELGEFIKQLKIPLSLSAEPWLIEVWQEFSFKWDRFITMSNDFEIGLFLEY